MFFPFKCIIEPPSFVLKPESQAVLPNTTVRFKSTFKGTPPFTVKWFKQDTELITGPSCFTGLEGLSCFIDLLSVGVSQSGTYSCQVSNDAGTVKCTADLLVKGWTLLFLRLITKNQFHHPILTASSSSHLLFGHGLPCICFLVMGHHAFAFHYSLHHHHVVAYHLLAPQPPSAINSFSCPLAAHLPSCILGFPFACLIFPPQMLTCFVFLSFCRTSRLCAETSEHKVCEAERRSRS